MGERRNELKQRIAPGFWIDGDDNAHVSVAELLEFFEVEDTPENRIEVQRIAVACLKARGVQHIIYRATEEDGP